jgi:hypothetical protein
MGELAPIVDTHGPLFVHVGLGVGAAPAAHAVGSQGSSLAVVAEESQLLGIGDDVDLPDRTLAETKQDDAEESLLHECQHDRQIPEGG